MSAVNKAPYVFIARGKVLFSGGTPEELLERVEEQYLGGAAVKSWRVHTWTPEEGLTDDILICLACQEYRRYDGSNQSNPCPFPERFDPSVTVVKSTSDLLKRKN